MTPRKPKRPPPLHGKGSTLNARVTAETRLALEAEAARTGRSLSSVVEQWLATSRREQARQALDQLLAMLLQDGHPDSAALKVAAQRLQELKGEIP